jgi:hypothetical protein
VIATTEAGADGEALDEGDAHEQHAEQRDHHGGAGEQHGPPGGVERDGHRLAHGVAVVELLAVAGDDEQRVVDADAQPDHHAQERGEVGDGHEVAEDGDDHRAEADAEQRHAHGQAHGQHRAERHDQDDDGEGQADLLGRGLLELGEHEPAQLDAQAVDVGHVRVDLVADLAGLGHVDVVGELDVGVGDAVRAVAPDEIWPSLPSS